MKIRVTIDIDKANKEFEDEHGLVDETGIFFTYNTHKNYLLKFEDGKILKENKS